MSYQPGYSFVITNNTDIDIKLKSQNNTGTFYGEEYLTVFKNNSLGYIDYKQNTDDISQWVNVTGVYIDDSDIESNIYNRLKIINNVNKTSSEITIDSTGKRAPGFLFNPDQPPDPGTLQRYKIKAPQFINTYEQYKIILSTPTPTPTPTPSIKLKKSNNILLVLIVLIPLFLLILIKNST
jgi:hypothetical protein